MEDILSRGLFSNDTTLIAASSVLICVLIAWILVKDHPFVALTDVDGKFEIKDLPVGKHKLTLFHERAEVLQKVEIEVMANQDSKIDLKYGSDRFLPKQK